MRVPARIRSSAEALFSSGPVRSAGVLVGGTAAAQALTVLALPLLTRLYSPTDFMVLAIFAGVVTILAYAATGRFDVAIPLPESDSEAVNLLVLSVLCAFATALLIAGVILLFGGDIAAIASLEQAEPYLWLVPISVFLSGSFYGIQRWWVRRKAFRAIATTRVHQTVAGVGVQLGMGALGMRPLGLLIGQMLISGAGSFRLMRDFWRADRHLLSAVNLKTLKSTAFHHRQFPQYSVVDALAANAGDQLPVIIIAALSGTTAGLLYLTIRIVGAPVQLIAGAVSQVYLASAGKSHKEGRLHRSTERLVTALMVYGAAPLLFGSFAAAPLFGLVFGPEWAAAGAMLMWVAPWFALRLVAFPLVTVPAVVGRQRLIMIVRLATLLMRIAAVYAGFYLWDGRVVEALGLSSMAHWLLLLGIFFSLAGVRVRQLGIAFFVAPVAAGVSGLLVGQMISWLVA